MLIISEFDLLFNLVSSNCKSREDLTDVGAWLHRDDTELILLVDPNQERFVVVVENSTCFRPLAFEETTLEILVATFKEEVVFDKLISVGIAHLSEGVVLALQFASEVVKDTNYVTLNLQSSLSTISIVPVMSRNCFTFNFKSFAKKLSPVFRLTRNLQTRVDVTHDEAGVVPVLVGEYLRHLQPPTMMTNEVSRLIN